MASAQIISPKSDEHTSNTSSHLQEIQAWGELYIFDLPKPLRTALFTKNLITFPYGTSLAPQARIEESEEIWTDNPGWINRIKLFDQAYRFDFFRCVLPESFGRESGLISEKPLTELKRLQYDDAIFGHRRWSLIIIGKEKIAALHLQTDLLKGDENETIKDRLVILKNEVIEPAPVVEGKKGRSKSYSKSKKEKAVEKLSRKSQRGVDRDTMNKAGSELLASWEKELERSELIFVGASRKQISTFFPESSLLYNKLRAFPFTFGAPTIEELKMCYLKLTTAKLDIEL
ncbi:uncharacterized protein MELLADRAFT_114085 [Melampsora larici-populina 98AG31]|uniref:VLRF1 domain-containing protein n=1 Tax=Melampsora larici-populina (strain 98AG31 / pathotype 3-4-7) TaxID=747676 RepID=F4SC45_MELLP|nr:uncharacterized protein MELLADRAFT_114085 [Melampsora larici-populina 98AG31]EGF97792.1 hypothetical protein MELLADRAFT_114085 [Melampsora larici-populina 98AG31]